MKKEESNNILDKILDNGFDIEETSLVPIEVVKTSLPAEVSEDVEKVRENLYDTSDKLKAVLDYLINNLDKDKGDTSFIKKSPIDEINDIAKSIVLVNTTIVKNANDQLRRNTNPPNSPGVSGNQNNTQNNFFLNTDKKFSLKDVDDMIKVKNENKSSN